MTPLRAIPRLAGVVLLAVLGVPGCGKEGGGCDKSRESGARYALLKPHPHGPQRKLSKGEIEVVFTYDLVESPETIKQNQGKYYEFDLVMRYQPKLGDIKYSTVARESLPYLASLDEKSVSATRSVKATWNLPSFEGGGIPVQQLLLREKNGREDVLPPNCTGY